MVRREVLHLCNDRIDLKKSGKKQKEQTDTGIQTSKKIQKELGTAEEDWIGNNARRSKLACTKTKSKRAYQLMKGLTLEKQRRSTSRTDLANVLLKYKILKISLRTIQP